jgi:hypothetical protein
VLRGRAGLRPASAASSATTAAADAAAEAILRAVRLISGPGRGTGCPALLASASAAAAAAAAAGEAGNDAAQGTEGAVDAHLLPPALPEPLLRSAHSCRVHCLTARGSGIGSRGGEGGRQGPWAPVPTAVAGHSQGAARTGGRAHSAPLTACQVHQSQGAGGAARERGQGGGGVERVSMHCCTESSQARESRTHEEEKKHVDEALPPLPW